MRQKDIWLVNLDPTVGVEIKKTRPCVLLNDDSIGILPLKVVAPVTDCKEKYQDVPWMVAVIPDKENNLAKHSVIDLFQVRSVSEERLIRRIGTISADALIKAHQALKIIFGMAP